MLSLSFEIGELLAARETEEWFLDRAAYDQQWNIAKDHDYQHAIELLSVRGTPEQDSR
jgi:hypothetical protein